MSVIVKATGADGTVGWGEDLRRCRAGSRGRDHRAAARAVRGRPRCSATPRSIWQDLYDLQRVRGASGGYYGDALAGSTSRCATWPRGSKALPLATWLGTGATDDHPRYVSGLPRATLSERVALAREFVAHGFRAIKYAAPVASEGVVNEMRALREALGEDVELMVDSTGNTTPMPRASWSRRSCPTVRASSRRRARPRIWRASATVAARARSCRIAAGEEWRNAYEAGWRLDHRAALRGRAQPEIAALPASPSSARDRRSSRRGAARS
jgi:galactonate dehydratase